MKMKVFRKIWIDKKSDLDVDNLGCHFTKDPHYTHLGGRSNGCTERKKILATITGNVKKYQVNQSATTESNLYHPKEKEVVLKPNQIIRVEVKFGKSGKASLKKANTGTRFDKWVENHL